MNYIEVNENKEFKVSKLIDLILSDGKEMQKVKKKKKKREKKKRPVVKKQSTVITDIQLH